MTVSWRGAFDKERTYVMRRFVAAEDDNERALWRNGNEIGMGYGIPFPTNHSDLVRNERCRPVEFANGLDDHKKRIAAPRRLFKNFVYPEPISHPARNTSTPPTTTWKIAASNGVSM